MKSRTANARHFLAVFGTFRSIVKAIMGNVNHKPLPLCSETPVLPE